MEFNLGFSYFPKWYEYSLHPHLVVASRLKWKRASGEVEDWGGVAYTIHPTEQHARDYIAERSQDFEDVWKGWTKFDLFRIFVEEDGYEMTIVDEVTIGTE